MLSQYFMPILNLAGLMALIALSFSGTARLVSKKIVRQVVFGAILGVGAVLISLQPIMNVSGIQIDPRNLFVGTAAAIFGPIPGAITFFIAAATRYHEAAPSASVCIFSLFYAGCAGLSWRQFTRDVDSKHEVHFVILGLTISLSYVSTFLLPRDHWQDIFSTAVPVLIATNVIGALVLGSLLERHRRQNEREQRLVDLASFDPLTEVMNRRAFEKSYESSVLTMSSSGTAIIIVDLDNFKHINDAHGHTVGDMVLVGISRILQRNIRSRDLCARFGGDEFLMCFPNTSAGSTAKIVARIQDAIFRFGKDDLDLSLGLSISVGVCWSEHPLSLDAAFEIADQSLYQAKVGGKNQVVFNDKALLIPNTPVGAIAFG